MRGLKCACWIAVWAVLGSCAEDSPSAIVQGVYVPSEECSYSVENDVLFRGTLDFSSLCGRPSYFATLLVESQLIDRGSPTGERTPVRADPNALRITGAEVELLAQGGETLPFGSFDGRLNNPFSVATTAVVPSAEEDEPGQQFAVVEIIPQPYVDAMREAVGPGPGGVIVASVKLFGETAGGVDVDVARFDYPITLCEGCLVVCREQIENDDDVRDAYESRCQANPGVNLASCVTNARITPECANFEDDS